MDYVTFTSFVCASRKNKPGNGLAAWRCGTCVKGKGKEIVREQPAQSPAKGKEEFTRKPAVEVIELLDDEVDPQVTKTAPSRRSRQVVEISNSACQDAVPIPNPNSNYQATNSKTALPTTTTSTLVRWRAPCGPPPTQPGRFINLTTGPSGPSLLQYSRWGDPCSSNHSTSPMRTFPAHTNIRRHYDRYENHDSRTLIVPETPQDIPYTSVQSNRGLFTQPMSLSGHKRTGSNRLAGPRGRSSTVRNLRDHRNHARHPDASIDKALSTQSAHATLGSSRPHPPPERSRHSTEAPQAGCNYEVQEFARKARVEDEFFDSTIPELTGHTQNSSTVHPIGRHPGGIARAEAERNHSSSMSPSSPPTPSTPTDDDDSDYVDREPPPQRASRPIFANAAQRERWRAAQRNKRRSNASKRARKPPPPRAKKRDTVSPSTEDLRDLNALQLTKAEERNHAWLFHKPITQYYPRAIHHPLPHRPTTHQNETNMEMDVDADSHQTWRFHKPTTTTQLPLRKRHRSVRQRGFAMFAAEVWADRMEKWREATERSRELRDGDSE